MYEHNIGITFKNKSMIKILILFGFIVYKKYCQTTWLDLFKIRWNFNQNYQKNELIICGIISLMIAIIVLLIKWTTKIANFSKIKWWRYTWFLNLGYSLSLITWNYISFSYDRISLHATVDRVSGWVREPFFSFSCLFYHKW